MWIKDSPADEFAFGDVMVGEGRWMGGANGEAVRASG
jgi:hypothetical protein